ncbi:MAG TPA: hypothetical protein VLT33_42270, partial [Labilithrix sp.]|nr:hypothetical protein [Labilithrix sp.]
MRSWTIALGLLVAVAAGVAIGARLRFSPAPEGERPAAPRADAGAVHHRVVAREGLHVDLFVPPPAAAPAPLLLFVHERGWPAPDEREREGAAIAEALQQRGIAVAVLSYAMKDGAPPRAVGEEIVATIRELAARAAELGIDARPVLAGDEAGATLVAALALDARYGLAPSAIRGVVGLNGIYDGSAEPPDPDSPRAHVRADAPPFLVLSAHGDSPRAAESSRAFARALERAGAKEVRAHHVSLRDA